MRTHGLPDWFCTFSFNDLHDKKLNKLYEEKYNLNYSNFDYIAIDPGIANEYFYNQVQSLLKFLRDRFGFVDHYVRFEF